MAFFLSFRAMSSINRLGTYNTLKYTVNSLINKSLHTLSRSAEYWKPVLRRWARDLPRRWTACSATFCRSGLFEEMKADA